MAAIALAESSGNPSAENDTDNNGTQTSWGLWQISNGTHSWPGSADPLNPENNARYAVQKLADQGLGAWGTYTSGAYRKYMSGAGPAPLPAITLTGSQQSTEGGIGGIVQSENRNAPYKVDSLKPPLTQVQRSNIITWLTAVADEPLNLLNVSGSAEDDKLLIVEYNDVLKGGGVGKAKTEKVWTPGQAIGSLFHAFNDFFSFLKNVITWLIVPSHWLRIFAGFGGFILFIIGGYMIVSSS